MSDIDILVVEDEPNIAEVVSLYLQRAGYKVYTLADGLSAREWLESQTPILVVLDIMLPKLDGRSLTRWIRDHSDVPIIILTARREEMDRIAGLEMGADDYIVKPFSPQELVSRVRAVLRRTHPTPQNTLEKAIAFPGLSIDPQARLVTVHDSLVELTAKEFDLLWLFARHPRRFAWRRPLAGPVAFPRLKGEEVEGFCDRLREGSGVLLLPGSVFGDRDNHFRIGFGRADLPEAVACLEEALR